MIPPILITGCARSGTSMTAGIVNMCGAFGGKMSGPTMYNKKGMFENEYIRNHIVKPYLKTINADPMGQDPLPNPLQLRTFDRLSALVEFVMKKEGYQDGPWFYKGAKMCLIWSIWRMNFRKAKWIIVRRDDQDIINSCMKTGFMRAYKNESGWQKWIDVHKERFEEMHLSALNVREVWPSKFIAGDFTEIKDCIEWLGLKWNDDIYDFITPALFSQRECEVA